MKPPWAQDQRHRSQDGGTSSGRSRTARRPTISGEHPDLQGVTIPRTGRGGRIGTLVTETLLIAGEAGTFTTPSGEVGAMLRAYDKATGDEVGAVYMPAGQSGSPMTYLHDGAQYIVVAVSGGGHAGELLAYRLPGVAAAAARAAGAGPTRTQEQEFVARTSAVSGQLLPTPS